MSVADARVLLIGLTTAMLAVFASGVFDVLVWSLLLAALVPTATAFALRGRPTVLRIGGLALAVAAAVSGIVLIEGGELSDIADAFTAGPRRLLSTDWPSPVRPDLVGTVAGALALLAAIAADLSTRARLHLLPLLPVAVGYVTFTALAAPLIRPLWLVTFLVLGAAFALLHPDGALAERLTYLRGERRLMPMLALALGVTGALSLPIALDARADPRDNQPPESSAALLDPIEAMLALRAIDPPIPVHGIQTDSAVVPTHWRTAALDRYNGRRWSPELAVRPIGLTLGIPTGPTIDYSVSFLDDSIDLLPLPGPPMRVDALVQTDTERTIVRISEDLDEDELVDVTAELPPPPADLEGGRVGQRPVDDTVIGLADLAATLAGEGTVRQQLDRLERTMREEFLLDPGVTGGGLQQRLMVTFLQETNQGNEEQLATGFVLLARALGFDARVATGFIIEPGAEPGAIVLSSSDAAIWPEVLIDDEWVNFDPIPEDVFSSDLPEPELPQTQTPAAPQPPVQPPPDPVTEPDEQTEQDDEEAPGGSSAWAVWAVRIGGVSAVFLFPIVVFVVFVLAYKAARRRRRLSAAAATDRVRGAWATATDGLVDAGVVIAPSRTDLQIAASGRGAVDGAGAELAQLATMSSAASFGSQPAVDHMADEAVVCLRTIETALTDGRTRWQRIRWRLSTRSMRRRTASPVTV